MKKLLLTLVFITLPLLASAQNGLSKVLLKNGTELQGTIMSIDPINEIKMVIAGIETSIKMSDIAKIEEVAQEVQVETLPANTKNASEEKLTVTDFDKYPESFELKVNDISIKMVLVRGGELYMGYDGRHSWKMKSEPVHKVRVTSFYISETFVTSQIASLIKDKNIKKKYYGTNSWDEANNIVKEIAQKSGISVRLPTEAEWEYAACSPVQSQIFNDCKDAEFCFDYFDEFGSLEYQIDPTGPQKGKHHVIRSIEADNGKYDRSDLQWKSIIDKRYFRLAIKAKDLKLP